MRERSRRPYGTGSLFESRGSWYGQWRVDGRLVKRKLGVKRRPGEGDGLTRRQAENRLRDLLMSSRPVAPDRRVTVEELGRAYLDHVENVRGRKATTIQDYRIMLNRHLVPYFGETKVDRITTPEATRYVGLKRREGLQPKTVANHLTFLHGLMAWGLREGHLERNPVEGVERPRSAADVNVRFLTRDELKRLLAAVPPGPVGEMERALYATAAMTGLRQGELLALRWQDVDFTAGLVRVRRSYTRGRFSAPKSVRSVRAVPLARSVAEALEGQRRRSVRTGPDELVFAHPDLGTVLDPSRLRGRFGKALERAGVRQIRFHDLRHTYGTHMAAAGTPLRMLQEWMGHSDYKTTLIYADYAPDPAGGARFVERAFG